jgi:hypothetical protein
MSLEPRWILVPLTQRHLDAGEPMHCYRCPLALALEEATSQHWQVTEATATMEDQAGHHLLPHGGHVWRLPPQVQALIRQIDDGEPVRPCALRLPRRFAPFLAQHAEKENDL